MERDHVDHLTEQWARRRPDLGTAALGLAARVLRLQRILARHAATDLEGVALNEGEFQVLAALRRAAPPHELTPTELYRSLLLSSGAMTHRLDRLESAGHVVRTPDEVDRRRVIVRLTPQGLAAIDHAMDAYVESITRLLGVLDEDERTRLSSELRSLLVRLESNGHPV
jgi:DNA-binding MarR family transcriptional regulator